MSSVPPPSDAGRAGQDRVTLWQLIHVPGAVVEVRALSVGPQRATWAGWFDQFPAFDQALQMLDARQPSGVYATLNPVRPALLERRMNQIAPVQGLSLTTDADVVQRRWLPIDLDPVRPSDRSATDGEHQAAAATAARVAAWLTARGWPAPVVADSGNGAHLLYRVNQPNTPAATALVQNCLTALAAQFDDEAVTVDRSVANPSRIWKAYGTTPHKGAATPDRPHRPARLLAVPEDPVVVSEAFLTDLAQFAPKGGRAAAESPDLVQRVLDRLGLPVVRRGPWQGGGTRWVLGACPFGADHESDAAGYVVRLANGAVAAGCHHARCQGRGWADLRARAQLPAGGRRAGAASPAQPDWGVLPDLVVPRPRFPVAALPAPWNAYVDALTARLGVPPDFVAAYTLAAASVAVGRSLTLAVTAMRHETTALWIAVVGRPGTGKTPAFQAALAPVVTQQQVLDAIYAEEKARYRQRLREDPTAERPVRQEVLLGDTTTEAAAAVLAANPRGVLLAVDEMGTWVKGLNAYRNGFGADREFYAGVWAASPVSVHRKQKDPDGDRQVIRLWAPWLGVVGGVQPGVLADLLSAGQKRSGAQAMEDGFLDRILFVFPPETSDPVRADPTPLPATLADALRARWAALWQLSAPNPTPRVVPWIADGRQAWAEAEAQLQATLAEPLPDWERGVRIKLHTYHARLALLWAALRAGESGPDGVSAADVVEAGVVVRYFTQQALALWSGWHSDALTSQAAGLWRWLTAQARPVTLREICRAQPARLRRRADVEARLTDFVTRGWGHWEVRTNPGARPSQVFIPHFEASDKPDERGEPWRDNDQRGSMPPDKPPDVPDKPGRAAGSSSGASGGLSDPRTATPGAPALGVAGVSGLSGDPKRLQADMRRLEAAHWGAD